MAGTAVQNIFEKDGQYVSFTVSTAPITLGQVVSLDTAAPGSVVIGTAALNAVAIGAAVAGEKFSRTSTDNTIAVGRKVTVITRGIVNLQSTAAVITAGDLVETANGGLIAKHTAGAAGYPAVLGMALTTVGAGGGVVTVKLFRG